MACPPRIGRGVCPQHSRKIEGVPKRETESSGADLLCTQLAHDGCEQRYVDATYFFDAHANQFIGDPYPAEVAATVYAVQQRLGFSNPYRLCWQSQVGPQPWLGPQTSSSVEEFVHKGQKDLILIPIAFTSDHIETLFELDNEVIQDSGSPETVKRAESLNGSPIFIKALADIAKTHLDSGIACSTQMGLRCPGCKSERCLESKKFFAGEGSVPA